MDQDCRSSFPGLAGRRLAEGRVEKGARRRRDQPERLFRRRAVDHPILVRQGGEASGPGTERRPIRLETELAVGMAETVEEMRGLEGLGAVEAASLEEGFGRRQAGGRQRRLDDLPRGQREARMLGPQALGQACDHVVVLARLARRLDRGTRDLQHGMAAGHVYVVVFEKGRGRQHDIGHGSRLGQELLMHADEEIVTAEA